MRVSAFDDVQGRGGELDSSGVECISEAYRQVVWTWRL
jgi:hypothetical protein